MRNTQANIIWESDFYHSVENCIIRKNNSGYEIDSTIAGKYKNQIFKVDYTIRTRRNWTANYVVINAQINHSAWDITLEEKRGKWFLKDKPIEMFEKIPFIDISLTPFTNTLPINGLQLKDNEQQVIDVIYFDILKNEINSLKQVYTRLGNNTFLYQNYDGSFSAEITVDETGLVIHYPSLFEMKSKQQNN